MAKKRGNGEGSVYQRANGLWVGAITIGLDANGKPRRKSVTGQTRAAVSKKLTAMQADHERGLPIDVKRQTLGQFLDRWLTDSVQGSVRPRTYSSYTTTVRLHITPALGRIELGKLNAQHVAALLKAKAAEGLSPRTVRYIRTVLRIALNVAVRWDLVPRNVIAAVATPKVERHEVMAWTPEQARRFLAAVRGDRLEALYAVALAVGMRQGEALALHWSDVDLDAGTVRVRYSLQRINGKLTLVQPKTETSRRTIDLPLQAMAALRAHWDRQMDERRLAGTTWKEHGLVFTTQRGTPLDKGNVHNRFKALLARAGLPHMRFHDLRHCCASLLLAQNVHPKVVQEILGHSQIAMTLDLYSHVLPSVRKDAATLMSDLLEDDLLEDVG